MYKASLGRLNNRAWPGVHAGTWCTLNNTGQWLQIDLGYLHVVTGVATQGRNSTLEHMWVKTYQLSFSKDGKKWEVYKENNITQVSFASYLFFGLTSVFQVVEKECTALSL